MGKVEIVRNSLPMSGGDGPNSYSKNSHLQVYFQSFYSIFLYFFSYLYFFFSSTIVCSFFHGSQLVMQKKKKNLQVEKKVYDY